MLHQEADAIIHRTFIQTCKNLYPVISSTYYLHLHRIRGCFRKRVFPSLQSHFHISRPPRCFNGYRILQLSDIHTGSWDDHGEALQRAVTLCNAQYPDLVAFTGDLVNSRADEMKPFMTILSQLHAKDGVYAVLGNHDYATYTHWDSEAERLANIDTLICREKQMGWEVLMNEHRILYRGNDSIAIAGVENSGNPSLS